MQNDILNFTLTVDVIIFVINIILATYFLILNKGNILYKYNLYIWVSGFISFSGQGFGELYPVLIPFLFSMTLIANLYLCRLINEIVGMPHLDEKKYYILMFTMVLTGAVLIHLNANFIIISVLIVVVLAAPVFLVMAKIMKAGIFKKISPATRLFLVLTCALIMHQLDFPFLRLNQAFAPYGFMIASIITLSLGMVALVVIAEKNEAGMQVQMSKMSESFARVSHDLKNPLILLTAQLNQISREQDPEKLRKKISGLASDHQVRSTVVMDMMKDIRLLSGLEAAKKSSQLDLKTTWDAACERVLGMQPILKFAGFQHFYSGDPLVVEMNKSDLERVLENLIKNAAEAMDRAGEISIQVEGIAEGRAQIVVSNTESFIAPEILNELQNQGQVSTKAKGSGLGLQVVAYLVAKYQGKVALAYEGGRFCVSFDLPLA